MQARFGDKSYDFLREINPPGNRESTGLVTRFGLGLSAGDKDFPVRVRLLTQTDIVKILGNSFLLDFDHQKAAFERPDGGGDPQAPGRACAPGGGPALRRSRFRRRARPDRVFRHLLRRRHRRAAHRLLARGDRSCAAPVGPRPRPAVVGAVVRLPALHRPLPDALRRPAEALLRARGAARHGRADPAREEHRRRAHARPAGRRRRRHPAGAAQAGRWPRRARCRAAALADLRADRRAFGRHRREAVGLLRPHRPSRLPGRALAIEARQPGRRRQGQGRGRRRQPAARAAAARQGRLSLPALFGRARARPSCSASPTATRRSATSPT